MRATLNGGGSIGCGAAALRKAAHSLAAGAGAGGALRRLATVRSRELYEALELARCTLQAGTALHSPHAQEHRVGHSSLRTCNTDHRITVLYGGIEDFGEPVVCDNLRAVSKTFERLPRLFSPQVAH